MFDAILKLPEPETTIFRGRFDEVHWDASRHAEIRQLLDDDASSSSKAAVCVRLGIDQFDHAEVISGGTENEDQLAMIEEAMKALEKVRRGLERIYG